MTITAELRNVTKTYGDKTILENVNLQIYDGEILALLGPNGSGKTTILKILALIENPTQGEINFLGQTVTAKNIKEMRMLSTLVFQKTIVFSTSVYNNVAYGLGIRKIPKKVCDQEVKNALDLVKLDGFENRPARNLSGGEQQRVAIARALILKTKLLLLDEPTANLDPKNASILEDVIATVNKEMKTTIVMTTHNMFQARTLPQRLALINEGRISEVNSTSEIFGKLSRNLASFGEVGNTFTGSALPTNEGTTIVDIGNDVSIEVTTNNTGVISIFISPKDIILSNNAIKSSARNVFKGRITEISDLGALVRLTVDIGKLFIVQITKKSFVEMRLTLNSDIFIAFKASSVQVL